MQAVIQTLILGLLFFPLPAVVGMGFAGWYGSENKWIFSWIFGQMLLWAGFLLISVPLILTERKFTNVVYLFSGYLLVMTAASLFLRFRRMPKVEEKRSPSKRSPTAKILWLLFFLLFFFQLVQALRLTYADWDDAFYVATSTITTDADTMYRKLPYTGGETALDARHGLAPFPIWIAYMAKISGMRTVSVAHMATPVFLISMSYGIFYLLGARLFAEKKNSIPLFMIFMEILVLFGNYSIYSVENFMIARSRQGKAAFGSIIVPALVFLLLLLLEKIQDKQKIPPLFWVLFTAVLLSGCLCSTMGSMLVCLLVGITGLCAAAAYRRFKILLPLAACCIPCLCFIGMYMVLQ